MAGRIISFDLDGTIWDSRPWYHRIITERVGEKTADRLNQGVSVARIMRETGLRGDFANICREECEALRIYPGVVDVLDQLCSESTTTAAVTNLPPWIAAPMLRASQLDRYFGTVYAWERGASKAARLRRVRDINHCFDASGSRWYVGDELGDRAAARGAGFRFAWVEWGYGSRPPNPDAVLSDFRQVLSL